MCIGVCICIFILTFFHSPGECGRTFLSTLRGQPPSPPPCLTLAQTPPVGKNISGLAADKNIHSCTYTLFEYSYLYYRICILTFWLWSSKKMLIVFHNICICMYTRIYIFWLWHNLCTSACPFAFSASSPSAAGLSTLLATWTLV